MYISLASCSSNGVKKKSPDYQTAAKRFRQLLIWSRLLEDCGMLWKWILQASSYLEDACQSPAHLLLPFVGVGRGWWWVCSAALARQKNEVPLPKCGLLFETCRILKVRNRDVWESPMCQPARGSEHLCTGWEGTSAFSQHELHRINAQGWQGNCFACSCSFLLFIYFSSWC